MNPHLGPRQAASPARVRRALRHWLWRLSPVVIGLIAIIPALHSLRIGWQSDDVVQRAAILGKPGFPHTLTEYFPATRAEPSLNPQYMDRGLQPWWTDEQLLVSFWRPLASVTYWLDYTLWPANSVLMHVHSLLWFLAANVAVGLLYRRIHPRLWVAALATLLYALDDSHGLPAGWLANRNALLATAFGALSLVAHDRWRRGGWRWGALAAPGLLALSLLSAELGMSTLAYLAGHALFLDRGRLSERLRALAPGALVFAAWFCLYRWLGHGAERSDVYISPMGDPQGFLAALASRGPIMLWRQWAPYLPLSSDQTLFLQAAGGALLLAGLVPLVRRSPQARFWLFGTMASLIPVCTSLPSSRHVLFIGFGAMGLTAQFLAGFLGSFSWVPRSLAWRAPAYVTCVTLLVTNFVLGLINFPNYVCAAIRLGEPSRRAAESLGSDAALAGQDLIIVTAPDFIENVFFILPIRAVNDQPMPRTLRALAPSPIPVELERVSEKALKVKMSGGMIGDGVEFYRSHKHPMKAGDEVILTGMTAKVLHLGDNGRPDEVLFTFDVPLEHPSLRWVQWEDGRYVPFRPPAAGQTLHLPESRPPPALTFDDLVTFLWEGGAKGIR